MPSSYDGPYCSLYIISGEGGGERKEAGDGVQIGLPHQQGAASHFLRLGSWHMLSRFPSPCLLAYAYSLYQTPIMTGSNTAQFLPNLNLGKNTTRIMLQYWDRAQNTAITITIRYYVTSIDQDAARELLHRIFP